MLETLTDDAPQSPDPLLSLETIKAHLRIEADETSEDELLKALGVAALSLIEDRVQRVYAERTIAWVRAGFGDGLRFPIAPVSAVLSIDYTDAAGDVRRIDPALYVMQPSGQTREIMPRHGVAWPSVGQGAEPVKITFRAGSSAPLPPLVRAAALLLCAHLYDNREATTPGARAELPFGIEAMISGERWS